MGSGSVGLEEVTRLTLQHYNQRAESFWEGTRAHDVTQRAGLANSDSSLSGFSA